MGIFLCTSPTTPRPLSDVLHLYPATSHKSAHDFRSWSANGHCPMFRRLGNVPTLRPHFSHFPPPLCSGASLRIIASPRQSTKNPPQTHQGLRGLMFILCRWFYRCPMQLTRYLYNVLMRSGNTGIAPCEVHTKALVSTATRWISSIGLRLNQPATKAAVKESPAPTVSATSTLGVS